MSESNGYFVYKHTNLINGKVYIGITRRAKPEDRWGKDGYRYAYNEHFYRAIQKYGWDNGFSHEILYCGLSAEEANAKEVELITQYQSYLPEFGYNCDLGGNGKDRMLPETIEKLRQIHTGAKRSAETRRRISEALIGHEVSDETRQKISANSKLTSEKRSAYMRQLWATGVLNSGKMRRTYTQEQKDRIYANRYRAIRCIETGKVYKSVLDAANDLCIHESSIRQVCNGQRKSAGGYHFENAK